MRARSVWRDDFPAGWFKSGKWWRSGLKELGLWAIALVAGFLLAGRMAWAVRHRRDPLRLSQLTDEVYIAAVLVNLGIIGLSLSLEPIGLWVVIYAAVNALVTGTVLGILVISRVRRSRMWLKIDYVQRYGTKGLRPPETIEEYKAQKLGRTLT